MGPTDYRQERLRDLLGAHIYAPIPKDLVCSKEKKKEGGSTWESRKAGEAPRETYPHGS